MENHNNGLGLVKKQSFHIPLFQTAGGKELKDVRLGYETYGKLNPARDNTVLIAHYYSGTSHCAGRYSETDLLPGYWDSIIGPGRAIDTNRFFVISADILCNVNVGDANVITTGPASINPETGKPYGMSFPIMTIGDFVKSQKMLLDSLGIQRLHAVAGPSLGSIQALEWAASYPEMVPRVIAAIPAGLAAEPYLLGLLDTWKSAITSDPNWNGGDYYGRKPPEDGLTLALKIVTISALHYDWADRTFGRRPHETAKDPADAFMNKFAIEEGLELLARDRAKVADANSFLYVAKAVQLFSLRGRENRIRAKVLMIPARSDILLFPAYAERGEQELRAAGVNVESFMLEGGGGHLDGLEIIDQASAAIRRFLA